MTGILTSYGGLRPDAKRYIMAGRGVVVDTKGRGDFTSIQDACDYMKGRGVGGRIWVRAGTYTEAVDVDQSDTIIEGESWDAIVDGATLGDALDFNVGGAIRDLQLKTTGGAGNNYFPIKLDCADFFFIDRVYISDSDTSGILINSQSCVATVSLSVVTSCDADGIGVAGGSSKIYGNNVTSNGEVGINISYGSGDNSIVVGNIASSNGTYGIAVGANDENCVVVGNRASGNSTGNILDNSGTSTVTGNDTT